MGNSGHIGRRQDGTLSAAAVLSATAYVSGAGSLTAAVRMSTWEDRMAARAKERAIAAAAAEAAREAAEQEQLSAEFPAIEGEDDWVEPAGGHRGHRTHMHYGSVVMCQCGMIFGVASVVVGPEAPLFGSCSVCAARGRALRRGDGDTAGEQVSHRDIARQQVGEGDRAAE